MEPASTTAAASDHPRSRLDSGIHATLGQTFFEESVTDWGGESRRLRGPELELGRLRLQIRLFPASGSQRRSSPTRPNLWARECTSTQMLSSAVVDGLSGEMDLVALLASSWFCFGISDLGSSSARDCVDDSGMQARPPAQAWIASSLRWSPH